jgi:hypothetical protein
MNISKALPGAVTLEYQDEDWLQTLDYEHIPFRCRRCHEHGHLFRDCPLLKQNASAKESKQTDGFTTVTAKRRNPAKKHPGDPKSNLATKNPYEILEQLPEEEEVQNPHKQPQQPQKENMHPNPQNPPPQNQESHMEDREEGEGDTPMILDDRELAGIDLEKLEEAIDQKNLQTLPEEQLRKVHKVFLNSSAGSTARLGIAQDHNSGSKKILRESRRRGRKPAHQLIKEAGNLLINSGQIQKLSEGYLHSSPPS